MQLCWFAVSSPFDLDSVLWRGRRRWRQREEEKEKGPWQERWLNSCKTRIIQINVVAAPPLYSSKQASKQGKQARKTALFWSRCGADHFGLHLAIAWEGARTRWSGIGGTILTTCWCVETFPTKIVLRQKSHPIGAAILLQISFTSTIEALKKLSYTFGQDTIDLYTVNLEPTWPLI